MRISVFRKHAVLLTTILTLLASGSGFTSPTQTGDKVDILWVVDSSGSMEVSQHLLAENFRSFIEKFNSSNLDYQIAVVSTDAWVDYLNPTDPVHDISRGLSRFSDDIRSADGRDIIGNTGHKVLNRETPDLEQVFFDNVQTGVVGNGDERGFQSMVAGLENSSNQQDEFLRNDAKLAIIMISDEDDFSHGGEEPLRDPSDPNNDPYNSAEIHSVQKYHNYLKVKMGNRKFVFNTVSVLDEQCRDSLNVDAFPRIIGQRYIEMSDLTGGFKGNLCDDFSDVLGKMSTQIIKQLDF